MAETTTDPVDEVRSWLGDNWDPDLTVAQWWDRLGRSGWAAPSLPPEAYGKGLGRADAVRVGRAIADFGALSAPGGLGMLLAAPTIAKHGTPEQVEEFVLPIVTGQRAWCQLFSEPGAGSDLAGLQARAERDGDEWIVNGQKVWTSGGQIADLGMLIARTNPDAPKHQGITYFAIDMHQPGMDVRPLRELTGRALFNEVFMTDARVPHDAIIGGENHGWAVANSTLMFERAGLGSGGGSGAASPALPGTIAGDLEKRVGDFIKPEHANNDRGNAGAARNAAGMLMKLASATGAASDPLIRQDLVRLYTLGEIGRISAQRAKALRDAGQPEIPGLANISKLSMSDMVRLQRDVGLAIVGAAGMLHGYDKQSAQDIAAATGIPALPAVTEMALFAQAPPIYGGTDQVQRNIIGERVLGLPKEPGPERDTPFRNLPKNG